MCKHCNDSGITKLFGTHYDKEIPCICRTPQVGETNQLVSCYFNLHKQVFSIKQGRLPVQHFDWVLLSSCSFVVRESGRQRVLQEKRKNVHASIKGILESGCKMGEKFPLKPFYENCTRVRYNPYLFGYFFNEATKEPIYKAEKCLLVDRGAFLLN